MKINRQRLDIRAAVRISAFAAFTAVCAWISVPAPIPVTLQLFAVFTAAGVLGAKKAVITVLLYILLGTAGLPVFSGGGAGLQALLGPTGGFLWGFVPAAFVAGRLCEKTKKSRKATALSMLCGLLCCYGTAIIWYTAVYLKACGFSEAAAAALWCVAPFVPADLLKIAAAVLAVRRISALSGRFSA